MASWKHRVLNEIKKGLIGQICFFPVLQCGAGGCLIELAQEMLVIMVGKQVINNIQEFIVP